MIIVRLWYDKIPPEIEVHKDEESFRIKLEELSNKYLSDDRYCVGYLRFEKRYIPHGIKINKGCRCRECELRDFWIPCSRCNGTKCINPHKEVRELCFNTKFYVYLAYFGGKTIKVGVARKDRLKERLLEQGAIAYKIYEEVDNGLEARRIENKLKEKFTDKLNYKQKVELYKRLDLAWFDNEYEIDGILEYNLENTKFLKNKKELKVLNYIPKVLGSVGQIVITEKGYFNFEKVRGRKIIERKNLMYFLFQV